jgi:hypothetical protein
MKWKDRGAEWADGRSGRERGGSGVSGFEGRCTLHSSKALPSCVYRPFELCMPVKSWLLGRPPATSSKFILRLKTAAPGTNFRGRLCLCLDVHGGHLAKKPSAWGTEAKDERRAKKGSRKGQRGAREDERGGGRSTAARACSAQQRGRALGSEAARSPIPSYAVLGAGGLFNLAKYLKGR